MSIICKRGVSIDGCRPEILIAAIQIEPIFSGYDVDLIITSGSEAYKHSAKRSAHYRGDAIDLRVKHLSQAARFAVLRKIKRKLGKDFIVLHEGIGKPWEHFHIHWSPVFGGD